MCQDVQHVMLFNKFSIAFSAFRWLAPLGVFDRQGQCAAGDTVRERGGIVRADAVRAG